MNRWRPTTLLTSDGVQTGAAKSRDAGDERTPHVTDDASVRRSLTVESEQLLDQAAGFARGGDYLGAQARARFAESRLVFIAASLPADDAFVIATHAHLDLRIRYYDSLVREWQMQVKARSEAYIDRERKAIGADPLPRANGQ
jgi:hypothetical protein